MRNDPFSIPSISLVRPQGHELVASWGKMRRLFQPLLATGVPLGGIGTGGVTRASDRRFSRWTIKGGGVRHFSMPSNGFVLRVKRFNETPVARALQPRPKTCELSAFSFESESPEWGGLFPLSWHRHTELANVKAECLSFSPVIPGDLASSCLPVALFRWRLSNQGLHSAEVSVAFHFANLNGLFNDFGEGPPDRVAAGCFNRAVDLENVIGVVLDRRRVSKRPTEGTGEWAIAMSASEGFTLSRTVCFDGIGDGEDFWEPFARFGTAPDLGDGWLSESGFRETPPGHPTAAVCAGTTIAPGETREITASLVWDLPVISFGQGRIWLRAYTDSWGADGRSAVSLAEHSLRSANDWESRIAQWHEETTAELGDAPHRAGMAINESYFLVDGLTVLTSATESPDKRSHFGIIECHDYALYNTLDLWIYAAEAVGRFFPELAASVAQDYAAQLSKGDLAKRRHRWDLTCFPVNLAKACPHDLGGPGEDPFVTPNSYTYRDSTLWKDLNCDLVICVYREGLKIGSKWRRDRFPAVRDAIEHLQQFDRDGDGLIENGGFPDQTFDNIPMYGASSYCGGLWIAALLAASRLAAEAGEASLSEDWMRQARKASHAFSERLFNGKWFRVDTDGAFSEACFIEQLFGPFLARRIGLGDIVPENQARSALKSIFQLNFLDGGGGEGAISLSGIPQDAMELLPHQEDTSFQTAEIQPGFNFSLAAQFEAWNLHHEAEVLRLALHREIYERRNLVFQTPAAYDKGRLTCRAILNMRPLAVWWMGK